MLEKYVSAGSVHVETPNVFNNFFPKDNYIDILEQYI